jgi:hypothetical protein
MFFGIRRSVSEPYIPAVRGGIKLRNVSLAGGEQPYRVDGRGVTKPIGSFSFTVRFHADSVRSARSYARLRYVFDGYILEPN